MEEGKQSRVAGVLFNAVISLRYGPINHTNLCDKHVFITKLTSQRNLVMGHRGWIHGNFIVVQFVFKVEHVATKIARCFKYDNETNDHRNNVRFTQQNDEVVEHEFDVGFFRICTGNALQG